jgi:hypothetical protein
MPMAGEQSRTLRGGGPIGCVYVPYPASDNPQTDRYGRMGVVTSQTTEKNGPFRS